MIRVAIIGAGYMGSAHARVLHRISEELPGEIELRYIVDVDVERAKRVSTKYGGEPLNSIDDIPRDSVDLALIATPTEYHYKVFKQLVEKNTRYFFIEKPMTRSLEEGVRLLRHVEENDLWVSVGHIERFNPAVVSLHRHVEKGELGEVLTIISRRVGPYTARVKHTDVIYDLGVHEIDNSLAIYKRIPERIRSYTLGNLVTRLSDYALIILQYDKGFSSLEVNRVTPFKQRIMYLTGTRGVAYLDYMKQELTIYNGEHEIRALIRREEPLYLEDLAVVKNIINRGNPPIDPYQAFTSLYLCELSLESTRTMKEIVIEDRKDYIEYKDILKKGLDGYKRSLEQLRGSSGV